MKEFFDKIKKDPKLGLIIGLGLFLIIFLVYKTVGEFQKDAALSTQNKSVINDVLIPKDDNKKSQAQNKTTGYSEYRNRNKNNNIDYDNQDLYVFTEESRGEDSSGVDQVVIDRAQDLKDRYYTATSSKNVREDFYQTQPQKRQIQNQTLPTQQTQTIDPTVQKKRRKGVGDSGGNMTMNKKNVVMVKYTIKAYVFNRDRIVKNGSTIRVMIDQPMEIEGITIPKNTILSGRAEFGQERVKINISSIEYKQNIYKVNLVAYGSDGQEGIFSENIFSPEIAQSNIEGAIESGSSKVNVPILGEVSIDLAKAKLREQSIIVSDGTAIILKTKK